MAGGGGAGGAPSAAGAPGGAEAGGGVLSPRGAVAAATAESSGVGVKMAELLLGSSPTSKDIDRGLANLSLRVSKFVDAKDMSISLVYE